MFSSEDKKEILINPNQSFAQIILTVTAWHFLWQPVVSLMMCLNAVMSQLP
jgi:hypothetical protein